METNSFLNKLLDGTLSIIYTAYESPDMKLRREQQCPAEFIVPPHTPSAEARAVSAVNLMVFAARKNARDR